MIESINMNSKLIKFMSKLLNQQKIYFTGYSNCEQNIIFFRKIQRI
jgi:hypothetical protein